MEAKTSLLSSYLAKLTSLSFSSHYKIFINKQAKPKLYRIHNPVLLNPNIAKLFKGKERGTEITFFAKARLTVEAENIP